MTIARANQAADAELVLPVSVAVPEELAPAVAPVIQAPPEVRVIPEVPEEMGATVRPVRAEATVGMAQMVPREMAMTAAEEQVELVATEVMQEMGQQVAATEATEATAVAVEVVIHRVAKAAMVVMVAMAPQAVTQRVATVATVAMLVPMLLVAKAATAGLATAMRRVATVATVGAEMLVRPVALAVQAAGAFLQGCPDRMVRMVRAITRVTIYRH